MANFPRAAALALRLIRTNGNLLTFTRKAGTFDPVAGQVTAALDSVWSYNAVVLPLGQAAAKDFDNGIFEGFTKSRKRLLLVAPWPLMAVGAGDDLLTALGLNPPNHWVRASLPSSVTETNGLVSAVADQSGSGNNLVQGAVSERPALVTMGGRPGFMFSGGQSLTSAAGTANQPNAIHIAFKATADPDQSILWGANSSGGFGQQITFNGRRLEVSANLAPVLSPVAEVGIGQRHVISVFFNGGLSRVSLDGVTITGTLDGDGYSGGVFGSSPSFLDREFEGIIEEIIMQPAATSNNYTLAHDLLVADGTAGTPARNGQFDPAGNEAFEPEAKDRVTLDGEEWQVLGTVPLKPKDTPVLYKCAIVRP